MNKAMYAVMVEDECGNIRFVKSNDGAYQIVDFNQPFRLYTMEKYARDLACKISTIKRRPTKVVTIKMELLND